MERLTLERRQVWIYLAAMIGGLMLGAARSGIGPYLEMLLWPVLTCAALCHFRASAAVACP
ncbi:hypothetical protein [Nitrosomonas sp.]|uniref:hypothetical protein n=1 Tax=Nitrosomonas sp. TaxID=42353 RepID=UPI0025D40D28|nr:hypothetical protein [Nitrosomonas sp.]